MKIKALLLLFVACCHSLVAAQADDPLKDIQVMREALSHDSVAGLLAKCKQEKWPAPYMPSQWHVDSVAGPEQRPAHAVARALGHDILVELNRVAQLLQGQPTRKDIAENTEVVLDLLDWIWGTKGYGNLQIAERAVDLAAVGVAKLACDLDFSAEICARLAARLVQPSLDVATKIHLLNQEAGVELFPQDIRDQETLERVWGTGQFYRNERANPRLRKALNIPEGPLPHGRETPLMKQHLDFFDGSDRLGWPSPITVLNMWPIKAHDRLQRGVCFNNPWNIRRARGLVEYRRLVGFFPGKFEYSKEQLENHNRTLEEYAKRGKGQRLSPLITDPDELGGMGFEQALKKLPKPQSLSDEDWRRQLETAMVGYSGFSLVQKGAFLDDDTWRERDWEAEQSRNK
jgi:glutaredoxin